MVKTRILTILSFEYAWPDREKGLRSAYQTRVDGLVRAWDWAQQEFVDINTKIEL